MEKMSPGLTGGLSKGMSAQLQIPTNTLKKTHNRTEKWKHPLIPSTKPGHGWEPALPLSLLVFMNAQFSLFSLPAPRWFRRWVQKVWLTVWCCLHGWGDAARTAWLPGSSDLIKRMCVCVCLQYLIYEKLFLQKKCCKPTIANLGQPVGRRALFFLNASRTEGRECETPFNYKRASLYWQAAIKRTTVPFLLGSCAPVWIQPVNCACMFNGTEACFNQGLPWWKSALSSECVRVSWCRVSLIKPLLTAHTKWPLRRWWWTSVGPSRLFTHFFTFLLSSLPSLFSSRSASPFIKAAWHSMLDEIGFCSRESLHSNKGLLLLFRIQESLCL